MSIHPSSLGPSKHYIYKKKLYETFSTGLISFRSRRFCMGNPGISHQILASFSLRAVIACVFPIALPFAMVFFSCLIRSLHVLCIRSINSYIINHYNNNNFNYYFYYNQLYYKPLY